MNSKINNPLMKELKEVSKVYLSTRFKTLTKDAFF